MTTLKRVVSDWTGFLGGPGYSVHYFFNAGGPAALRTFWSAIASRLPTSVTIQVRDSGEEINDANGQLVGAWSEATPLPVVGTGAGDYAAPVGFQVRWDTPAIVEGRRLRGRTFVVPAIGSVFDSNGTMEEVVRTSVKAAGDALVANAAELRVWSRPQPDRVGSSFITNNSFVPDKPVVLTSRRD